MDRARSRFWLKCSGLPTLKSLPNSRILGGPALIRTLQTELEGRARHIENLERDSRECAVRNEKDAAEAMAFADAERGVERARIAELEDEVRHVMSSVQRWEPGRNTSVSFMPQSIPVSCIQCMMSQSARMSFAPP